MTQMPPETGDPVVDEVLRTLHGTSEHPLIERAEAAQQAQRRLQERLTESAPDHTPAAAMERVAGAHPSA